MALVHLSKLLRECANFSERMSLALHQLMGGAGGWPPTPALAVAGGADWWTPVLPPAESRPSLSDSLLWAVPKKRRSVERRMTRRYGADDWPSGRKLLYPKNNLIYCLKCGGHHLPGMLCLTCYNKVIEETKEIQSAMVKRQGLKPVDKEVAVLYKGEEQSVDDQQAQMLETLTENVLPQELLLVELPKSRPRWFSRNLEQKAAAPPSSDATAVRPSDLG